MGDLSLAILFSPLRLYGASGTAAVVQDRVTSLIKTASSPLSQARVWQTRDPIRVAHTLLPFSCRVLLLYGRLPRLQAERKGVPFRDPFMP